MSSKSTTVVPPDQAARQRIASDLESTLFVEAGAGSGKTTALVGRVVALIASGEVELRSIAAITFTEKAGAELRDRIRQDLEKALADPALTELLRERYRTAVSQLDGAAIGTLHSFAQRILAEHAIEAGLPPRVEVADEVSSDIAFERRWETFLDELLEDPAIARTLGLLLDSGLKPDAIRALALAFEQNWDLVADRVPDHAPEPPPVSEVAAPLLDQLEELVRYQSNCTDPSDKLFELLSTIGDFTQYLRAEHDDTALLAALTSRSLPDGTKVKTRPGNLGRKVAWAVDKAEVTNALSQVDDNITSALADLTQAAVHRLAVNVRSFTLEAAEARRRAGQLSFHDLLVMCRQLLCHPSNGGAVRQRLHDRYQRILLDEFQDTDPIQIELAVRIAAADPTSEAAGSAPWAGVAVSPGHLFFVGDPKQSIYRFRRADISMFLEARRRLGKGGLVELTTNFRTVAPVIDTVNEMFARLIVDRPEVEMPVTSQPDYVALHPVRPIPPVGPAVSVVGRTPIPADDKATATELREAEATEVAATVVRAVSEGWSIGTGDDNDPWRPARLGDITILVPARTSLPMLEDALDRVGVPFRSESSSLVYSSRAIRDLLMVLRAADDPTDHLSIVSALRTPLLACGDDDLFRFKVEQHGHWDPLAPQPDTVVPGPVSEGLAYLAELNRARYWSTPAELLARIVTDRRVLELGFAEGRPRDLWRRVRFVIDQARSWGEASTGGTRQYLQWVQRQSAEGARVAEAVLPETDDDAVRIMTIHASKGLEFPVTIVSGMSTVPQARPGPAQVVFPPDGSVGYRFGSKVTTQAYSDFAPIDVQLGLDERIRLLYVACTRARDHLVISLQRNERASTPALANHTNAELLVRGLGPALDNLPDAVSPDGLPVVADPPPPAAPPPDLAAWRHELETSLAVASRPSTVAATALTADGAPDAEPDPEPDPEAEPEPEPAVAGLHKRPRDLDLPPWLKGRYGTAVGRAVHGVLQNIDLADPHDLAAVVAAQCEAEAIPERADTVADLVSKALESPVIVEAARCPHWREVYACAPVGSRLLEGYLDLLFRRADGLVVVDYKTAATTNPAELADRARGYRQQGAAYAHLVTATTGESVVQVVFVFLTPAGAIEISLEDLESAMHEVLTSVTVGREVLTTP